MTLNPPNHWTSPPPPTTFSVVAAPCVFIRLHPAVLHASVLQKSLLCTGRGGGGGDNHHYMHIVSQNDVLQKSSLFQLCWGIADKICTYLMYNMIDRHMYTLWNDYHNQVNSHIYFSPFIVVRTLMIYSQQISIIKYSILTIVTLLLDTQDLLILHLKVCTLFVNTFPFSPLPSP